MDAPEQWIEGPEGLRRTFRFPDFDQALAFVVAVGRRAREADHHPDVELGYGRVTLVLLTHSAGKVTAKDHALARAIDAIPAEETAAILATLTTS